MRRALFWNFTQSGWTSTMHKIWEEHRSDAELLILSILAHCISCDIALIDLRYAQLCVFKLLVFWVVLPYNLVGRYRYHELNKDCQPRRIIRFKIPSPFSNPMTITCLPQILNMAAYLVLLGVVELKPLNPDDTGEGK